MTQKKYAVIGNKQDIRRDYISLRNALFIVIVICFPATIALSATNVVWLESDSCTLYIQSITNIYLTHYIIHLLDTLFGVKKKRKWSYLLSLIPASILFWIYAGSLLGIVRFNNLDEQEKKYQNKSCGFLRSAVLLILAILIVLNFIMVVFLIIGEYDKYFISLHLLYMNIMVTVAYAAFYLFLNRKLKGINTK